MNPAGPANLSLDALVTMVVVVGADGRCVDMNMAFEACMGVSHRHLLGLDVRDWMSESTAIDSALEALGQNRVSSVRFDGGLRRLSLGAGHVLPVHVIVHQSDRADRIVIEMIEIQQQVRVEREEWALGLAQANKELLRNLAHEIKNPLGGIRGAAQLLGMDIDNPSLAEYIQVIISEADRLQSLVDRLLAPHRRAKMVGDVNIHEVCEHVRALVLAEHRQGLTIVRDYDTSIPEFRGDKEQLIQALLNVVQNAALVLSERKAAGDAVITLRTRIARQVTIGKHRWRLALELHVEDNGPGVPAEIQDRLFQPLVSGREGGTGLGLTLTQTFVQQHQGTISCASVPGQTVFTITIPLP